MQFRKNILFDLFVIANLIQFKYSEASDVSRLIPGSSMHVVPEVGNFGFNVERLNIYCYAGGAKNFVHMLLSVNLKVEIENNDFNTYAGYSVEDVELAHINHKSIFSLNFLTRNKKRDIALNPFNQSCVGIETRHEYKVFLNVIQLDLTKLMLLLGGIILFFSSEKLSRNYLFFYLTGVLLGVFASFLVLIWFCSKLIPKKPLMYGVLATGWTLMFYFATMIFENIQPILITYQSYVIWYFVGTGCISFIVCYRMGPPKNQRSKDLIKWGLQFISFIGIFFSSEFYEATIGIILSSLFLYYIPLSWIVHLKLGGIWAIWRRRYPSKRQLLSQEEYQKQGRIETEKALRELREYVSSPKCKQWKVVSQLREPSRFASFVEGNSHITQDETTFYENSIQTLESDEESDSSLVLEENPHILTKSQVNRNIYKNFNLSRKVNNITPTTNGNRSYNNSRTLLNGSGKHHDSQYGEISDDE
ncbi:unnamed protein product [Diamesa serratosioi]